MTREVLEQAFRAIARRGSEPRHDCGRDGHVSHYACTTCVYCREVIRELTPDENHLLLGEFL